MPSCFPKVHFFLTCHSPHCGCQSMSGLAVFVVHLSHPLPRFLQSVHRHFMTDRERMTWVSFNPQPDTPSHWGGRVWLTPDPVPDFVDAGCRCEDSPGAEDTEGACAHALPVRGTGLAFQNMCKGDPGLVAKWRRQGRRQSYAIV